MSGLRLSTISLIVGRKVGSLIQHRRHIFSSMSHIMLGSLFDRGGNEGTFPCVTACMTWKSLNPEKGRSRDTSSYVAFVRRRTEKNVSSKRTYMVIPNAHTSLSFDCLILPCSFHSSGDQNADVPFVVEVTWPCDRLIFVTICEHPKSLMTALLVVVTRMLSLPKNKNTR